MNYDENLTYDWLKLLKEETSPVLKASTTRPAAAKAFGDFEYTVDEKDRKSTRLNSSHT